uniref:Aminotransferase class V domain-containing protein n=1 Tax=Aureoumbra lagunensis TaxID=44058 RepID=A0A7S3JU12_9STRA|mmetsp:Transcript_2082/g.2747  ORF Transcript_2082/g.2747 Transcript_2082/m.2747 type:complete len:580 (-) Transcript_2082:1945-3684(-)|eukprot:CAMPEP_0197287168 /NCGR_PEP_ID=MMETSP0890-20130614/3302_1 /TAXON_ID=44058 ORGANISM="Aureoumbra lagunensis, Strain CCMP1510" /NCGR_SAMPLE_ID=MMETSP0890 /ASSEMBLY_ACC=CAM_ASM_000533 /LENGTH=579 /DNA_ID=CAMNT_0042756523 /DNA_START=206 /DNA_END=1945 /DNA_ORIENTATION=-
MLLKFVLLVGVTAELFESLGEEAPVVLKRDKKASSISIFDEEKNLTSGILKEERDEFVSIYGNEYGYPEKFGSGEAFDKFVYRELGVRLNGDAYLDWAGSALYTQQQIDDMAHDLKTHVYGNPHSLSSSATLSTDAVESARLQILEFLGASESEYEVIFTRSCTDSLRLVADAFPWQKDMSEFRYLVQNHNSVLGIRDVARSHGAHASAVEAIEVDSWLHYIQNEQIPFLKSDELNDKALHLFAYPGEENFAGEMFPMDWAAQIIRARKEKTNPLSNWRVLIDAAKLAAAHPINLTQTPVDFLTMSFYKLFGAPTGVGALIARKETAEELTKCYWGGGSVTVAGAGRDQDDDIRVLKSRICERFEDGTVSFLGIAALKHGFKALAHVGGPRAIEIHTEALSSYLDDRLRALKHTNGQSVVLVYGPDDRGHARGPVVNFNLLDRHGNILSHIDVMQAAADHGIHVRAGVECNPGAGYSNLGLPPSAVQKLATDDSLLGCGAGPAFVSCKAHELLPTQHVSEVHFGYDGGDSVQGCDASFLSDEALDISLPTGSIRASLGYLTTYDDVDKLIRFVQTNFLF